MCNYSKKNPTPTYPLCFLVQGDGTEWIDYDLPTPHWFKKFEHSYLIGWLLDGFFSTHRGNSYLNDVIARLIFTLPIKERLQYRPKEEPQVKTIYKLKDFKSLKSLPPKFEGYRPTVDSGKDRIFWAIKWKVEQIIKEQGEGRIVSFDLLHTWAKTNFVDEVKDRSTLKAKCRSVWNWYDSRNWTIPTKREFIMSRSEHIKQVHAKRREESKRKVLSLVTGMFADDYKTKTGKWNISKIAKELNMGRDTVRKYLKEI